MTETSLIRAAQARSVMPAGRWDALARKLVFAKLSQLKTGQIRLVEAGRQHLFGNADDGFGATVHVADPRFYRALALGGSLGGGEAYIDGLWSADDVTKVCRILARNADSHQQMEKGWGRLTEPLHGAFHRMRRNTLGGSRRNIAAHYDLGNDFFRLFLDETMMYSCAVFPREDASLEEASVHKNERICRKLDLLLLQFPH